MVLAAYGSGLYKLLLLGHIISFLVAFSPAVISPVLAAQAKKDGEGVLMAVAGHLASNGRRIHFPALIALGGFGISLVLVSDPAFGFDQTWVGLALVGWIAIAGVVSGLILPNERKLAAGDLEAEKKVAMGGQIVTVLLLVMLYLMIWKPGL
jgi:uncharacterized membrane protein